MCKEKIKFHHSVQFKVFVTICAVSLAFVGILTFLNLFFYKDYYLYEREKMLLSVYHEISASYEGSADEIYYQLGEIENENGVRLTIINAEGTLKYNTIRAPEPDDLTIGGFLNRNREQFSDIQIILKVLSETDEETVEDQGYSYVTTRNRDDQNEYLCLVGLVNGDEYLIVRSPFAFMEQNSSFNLFFLLVTSLITLLLCVLLAYFISQRFSRPIVQIADIANSMAELDFSKKYEGRETDEIGLLGQSVNSLSHHLEEVICELQRSNTQLAREVKEKERIDQLRQEFIVNVSHELKTPIAVIQGYAEGLKMGVADDPADRDFYCDTIGDEAKRMNQMVMQLLGLSKLELGRETPDPSDCDLYELCRAEVRKNAVLSDEKRQKVLYEDTHVHVETDENMLLQIITNYLSNAIRYTPADGKIILRAVEEPDGAVTFSVFNEGDGLSEDELQNIWEKFYRTDKARSRESGGTGIGLSIVHAIADTLGATCGAEDVEGGINFWFRFPPKTTEAPEETAERKE